MKYEITKNETFGSYEIKFDGKPSEAVRDALKANGYRWHGVKKLWYGYKDVSDAIRDADELVIPESKPVDEGTMYEGWEGGNNHKWSDEKELKSFLLADFKKAGIKASIRFRRAGYLTALTVTISIKSSDILPFEEWSESGTRLYGRSWPPYYDDAGVYKEIHESEFFNLPDDQRDELAPKILKTMYQFAVSHLSESGTVPADDVLTDDAKKRYQLVKAIVGSYNRDCSNSMIDYFDRDIYDRYTFKITDAAA